MLALALLDSEGVWVQRSIHHAATWQWYQEQVPTPIVIQLEAHTTPAQSRIHVLAPPDVPDDTRHALVQHLIDTLRRYDFEVVAATATDPSPNLSEDGVALLVAPQTALYRALARRLREVVTLYDLRLFHPDLQGPLAHGTRRLVAGAALVLGAWEAEAGRNALYLGLAEQRPAVALVRGAGEPEDWPGLYLDYTDASLLDALDEVLRDHFARRDAPPAAPPVAPPATSPQAEPPDEATPPAPRDEPASPQEPATPPPDLSLALPIRHDERRRIYRRVALDRRTPPEQRFHAARVLYESGDAPGAARALGTIIALQGEGPLVDDALGVLGTLGAAAHEVLWWLDARTTEPNRAIAVARELARAGDVQTALFRLERLVQHEEEAVRLAALDAIAGTGVLARRHFEELATEAHDPKIRFRVARLLFERGEAPDVVRETLAELATSPDVTPALVEEAVALLGRLTGQAINEALRRVAQQAPHAEARLAAATELHRRGERLAARAVLLRLARGRDDLAAGAALDLLLDVSDEVTDDTERVMNGARLKAIRRRAAAMLGQPHQPEAVQQAAAQVLLSLDRPVRAQPIIARLAQRAADVEVRRWAARQLTTLGPAALDDVRRAFAQADDPIVGQILAEGLLAQSSLPDDQRAAAAWLAEHSNLPRAVEVLAELARSARVSGSDAVQATNNLAHYAENWAGAARALATLVGDSPHPAVRARALDLLLREYPAELPLSLLVDLAVTGSIGPADRSPVMNQLSVLARPAAGRIAQRLIDPDVDTERRWRLLQLITELPETAATPALLQLSARAPQTRIRYVAAEQLVARGHRQAGYAALATIAIDEPDPRLREMALYELAQGLPETAMLFHTIIERTRYESTFSLARELLAGQSRSLVASTNQWLDSLLFRWEEWVATLPLGWFDRLTRRLRGE